MLDPMAPAMVSGTHAAQPAAASIESGDFQTFLTMLTAQIQNQNPLEPIQSSDFAVQLATFSGVEQQVQTNQLLTQLSMRLGLADLAGWVGREVLGAAPLRFEGRPVTLVPPEVAGANRAELVVTNGAGREIGRYPIDPTASEIVFDWPANTPLLEQGDFYSFSVASYRDETELGENPVLSYSNVREARADAGQTFLLLDSGYLLNSADVVGLRDPETL